MKRITLRTIVLTLLAGFLSAVVGAQGQVPEIVKAPQATAELQSVLRVTLKPENAVAADSIFPPKRMAANSISSLWALQTISPSALSQIFRSAFGCAIPTRRASFRSSPTKTGRPRA